ncbi:MAG TPA: nitroreductase/quinone reductase family protein [Solirubrobacteraceae bacterium]|nr:nitroreductase/quinone reductase family protein [Solirubrobacteraceae bacterium]
MRDDVRQALAIGPSSTMQERTIDITTTGRKTGQARRLETVFYRFDDEIYLSGIPASRPRAWLLNMQAQAHFTFHLKHEVTADVPASAEVITDPEERRRILSVFVEQFNARRDPDGPYPVAVLDEWVADSPLVRVNFAPDA